MRGITADQEIDPVRTNGTGHLLYTSATEWSLLPPNSKAVVTLNYFLG